MLSGRWRYEAMREEENEGRRERSQLTLRSRHNNCPSSPPLANTHPLYEASTRVHHNYCTKGEVINNVKSNGLSRLPRGSQAVFPSHTSFSKVHAVIGPSVDLVCLGAGLGSAKSQTGEPVHHSATSLARSP
ncbi:hypothetical protein J6590_001909 [Homalodisca vitripennis]|nr:hypothetical protein J6590_001909 [Homalodisca vitripennis]